ncbi:MAG: RDD family protein [Patulibacter minatonensis]
MAYIDPFAAIREEQAAAAVPKGHSGVVIAGRLHEYAPIRSRVAATVIDVVAYKLGLVLVLLLGAWVVALTSLDGDGGTSTAALAICVGYIVMCFGPLTYRGAGQSVGKRIAGLRVVRWDGARASLGSVLLRELPWRALPLIVLPIQATPSSSDLWLAMGGVVIALLATADPLRQTFYDRLAGTVVVNEDPIPMTGV